VHYEHTDFPPGSEVRQLLDFHAEAIGALRGRVERHRLYDASRHDDLHLLRFLLSHKGKVDAAAAAFEGALEWREEHGIDAISARILKGELSQRDFPGFTNIHHLNPWYTLVAPDGGVVLFNAVGECNFHKVMESTTVEEFCRYQWHMTELSALLCDRATRRTGRLVRQVKVVDVSGASLSMLNMRFMSAVSAASKKSEDAYPQLAASMYVCNAGAGLRTLFERVAAPLLPKRLREKVVLLEPRARTKDRERLLACVPSAQLPEHVGGKLRLAEAADEIVTKTFPQLCEEAAPQPLPVHKRRSLSRSFGKLARCEPVDAPAVPRRRRAPC